MGAGASPPSRPDWPGMGHSWPIRRIKYEGATSSVSLWEDCVPAGDPQRVWFPEMIQKLRADWHVGMSFSDLIELRDSLDAILHEIRFTRCVAQ